MSGVVHPPESVYTHLMKGADNAEKPPRYMSKFRPTVVLENKLTKVSMRTMGPAKVEVPSPEKYLKKQTKEPRLPEKPLCSKEKEKEARHICSAKKPAVPARTDEPPLLIHTKRDFTKTNTTTLVSMKPQPTCVDNHKGHKQRLENSGLVPKYTKKKDYGEVPEYILQRRERERRAQEEYDDYVKEQKEHGAMTHLSDQERQNILEDLKKNWDELHHEYQGLSLVVDTLTKKTHKERLEAAMKQLEQDINLFERFKTIYVPNN